MTIVQPSFEIETPIGAEMLARIERVGRTCYKSEDRITDDSAEDFVAMLLRRGHESVVEHVSMSVRFICDRGVSHELVRHRLASFAQESTRYCTYKDGLAVIQPVKWPTMTLQQQQLWYRGVRQAEYFYTSLLGSGMSAQDARDMLPTCTKTEVVVTTNLRHWREILRQRTDKAAHPAMRALMSGLLAELKRKLPTLFNDIA